MDTIYVSDQIGAKIYKISVTSTPVTQPDWSFQLISSPFPLEKDIVLFGQKISEPFEISFDIVITGLKDSKGFIFVMVKNVY